MMAAPLRAVPMLQRADVRDGRGGDSLPSLATSVSHRSSPSGWRCERPTDRAASIAVSTVVVLAGAGGRHRGRRHRRQSLGAQQPARSFSEVWRGALFRREQKGATLSLLPLLQDIYTKKILPLERRIQFARLSGAPELTEAYFYAKPLVTAIGQYSTGKSSLITELLGTEYPGVRIGPQPTTDSFVAVMAGPSRQVVPGFALCSDPSKPFGQLQRFGSSFLDRLQASLLPESEAPILKQLCFIDTPGVLSGDKQRLDRSYDIEGAVGWFAENSDLVLVLLDPNKLDISDEFRRCLAALGRSERKVRFILNKADQLSTFELIRVYGALMWSLSKVISSPEMVHVTVASFGKPQASPCHTDPELKKFLEGEQARLRQEVMEVPYDNTTRKVNDLVRRARLARCHGLLVDHLARKKGGLFTFGAKRALQDLISHPPAMAQTCSEVAAQRGIPVQDFLPAADLCKGFDDLGIGALRRVPAQLLADVEEALQVYIPPLMDQVTAERDMHIKSTASSSSQTDKDAEDGSSSSETA